MVCVFFGDSGIVIKGDEDGSGNDSDGIMFVLIFVFIMLNIVLLWFIFCVMLG